MSKYLEDIRKELNAMDHRSAWAKGVNEYAQVFVDDLDEFMDHGDVTLEEVRDTRNLEHILLNGAENWYHYSWGGSSLCYNRQIIERLCPPSIVAKYPARANKREQWLDVQARALYQAYWRVRKAIAAVNKYFDVELKEA